MLPPLMLMGLDDGAPFCIDENRSGVSRITVRAGKYVDGIQFHYRDGTQSCHVGGYGGSVCNFIVPERDEISSVTIWSGLVVDAIQFHTRRGLSSERYGGEGGTRHDHRAPMKCGYCTGHLAGMTGRCGLLIKEMTPRWQKYAEEGYRADDDHGREAEKETELSVGEVPIRHVSIDNDLVERGTVSRDFDSPEHQKLPPPFQGLAPATSTASNYLVEKIRSLEERLASTKLMEDRLGRAEFELEKRAKDRDNICELAARLSASEEAVSDLKKQVQGRDALIDTLVARIDKLEQNYSSRVDPHCTVQEERKGSDEELRRSLMCLEEKWEERYKALEHGTAIAIASVLGGGKATNAKG